MKKTLYVLMALVVASAMVLTSCGGGGGGPVQIRWFVGLGTGTDPAQVEVEQALVDEFNATHDNIELILEVVPYDSARDTLATQIAAGEGPDVIGPVGWAGSNAFFGQWLELSPYMDDFDTSEYDPALIDMYISDEGQLGLPFLVFPAAIFYIPAMFDEAGLNYPPAEYGEAYVMPDGASVTWDYDAFTEVARLLTIDANGLNATQEGFDRNAIVQYGFHPTWSGHPSYIGAFHATPSYYTGSAGSYETAIPDAWKDAWEWYYDGIWGNQPFMPNGAVAGSPEFGSGNTFNSGKIAMTITNLWYTCCLGDFASAGNEFQFGAIPVGADGQVHSRVDADTFRAWKGSAHPAEAFEVLAFLIGPVGTEYLVVGHGDLAAAYGGFPSLPDYQQPYLDSTGANYPFVTTWDTILAGLAYPDVPSAEGYMPNWNEGWARIQTFGDLMNNTEGLNLATEIATLEADLTVIFNK
ncbi:MAG: extracellular solute-binding protein [Anaerolineales bacterium]|nr:extracellular solute-binding protein [Anaerolineales bacterium]